MLRQPNNGENLPSESLNNTSELKRLLDEEREKVKQLSSQLNTNVIILTSIIAYKIELRNDNLYFMKLLICTISPKFYRAMLFPHLSIRWET